MRYVHIVLCGMTRARFLTPDPSPPRLVWCRPLSFEALAEVTAVSDEPLKVMTIPLLPCDLNDVGGHVQYWRAPDWAEAYIDG